MSESRTPTSIQPMKGGSYERRSIPRISADRRAIGPGRCLGTGLGCRAPAADARTAKGVQGTLQRSGAVPRIGQPEHDESDNLVRTPLAAREKADRYASVERIPSGSDARSITVSAASRAHHSSKDLELSARRSRSSSTRAGRIRNRTSRAYARFIPPLPPRRGGNPAQS